MINEQKLEIGQRFESLGIYKRRVWEVVDIYATPNRVAHAKLRDVQDRATVCTLAIMALLDTDRFRAVDRDEAAPDADRDVADARLPDLLLRCAERAMRAPRTRSAADQSPPWLDLRAEPVSAAPDAARSESSRSESSRR